MTNKINRVAAGEFKAKCLKLMDDVSEKHSTLVVTKHGKPIVKLVPYSEEPVNIVGCMKGTAKITGDIVSPINVKWEAGE